MYTFFLMVEPPVAADWPCQLLKRLGRVYRDDGYFLVTAPAGMEDGWIAVSQVEPVMESQNDMEQVYSLIKDPVRFMVEGRDTKTNYANQLLLSIGDSTKGIIDNDHGYIASVRSFQSLARAQVLWLTVSQAAAAALTFADNGIVQSMLDVVL